MCVLFCIILNPSGCYDSYSQMCNDNMEGKNIQFADADAILIFRNSDACNENQ